VCVFYAQRKRIKEKRSVSDASEDATVAFGRSEILPPPGEKNHSRKKRIKMKFDRTRRAPQLGQLTTPLQRFSRALERERERERVQNLRTCMASLTFTGGVAIFQLSGIKKSG
jgi:hypothetical protein